jgi:hypothetical protein
MRMRIAGELLSMGRWARVLVLMPALKTAGAAREAVRPAYIAPGRIAGCVGSGRYEYQRLKCSGSEAIRQVWKKMAGVLLMQGVE